MQLDEFVKNTLEQIVAGVRQAQSTVAAHGAIINPVVRAAPSGRGLTSFGTVPQEVEFDVAVTVTEADSSGAGLRVGIAWVGGKVEGGSNREHSEVSRIKFAVPVAFPPQST